MGEAEIIDQFIAAVIEHKEMPLYAGLGAIIVLIIRLARKKNRHETKSATEAQTASTAAQIEHTAAIKAMHEDQQKNQKELLEKLECIKRLQAKDSHNKETMLSNQKEITSKVMDIWANTKNK